MHYTYIIFYRKDCNKVNWLFVVKIKPWSHVQVVNDGNDEVTKREYVFRLDELVDLYRVASSIEFKKNSKFYIIKNTYVHVDLSKMIY